jgi:hypothetical protein
MTQFEKRGIPTVLWTAERFVANATASSKAFGLPAISLAKLPTPGTGQTEEALHEMVSNSIQEVIDGLTKSVSPNLEAITTKPAETFKYQADDLLDASEMMNQSFLKEAWSDGFPLIPPTPQAVERMLSGTKLSREEVIGLLEPGFGIASVEKIAINAVMAGCQPEHLPVVITAVQCLIDPMMHARHALMSTGPQTPLIVVNGPIVKKANINAKSCALGPGSISFSNVVIGRALRLIIMNIGHCYPGVGDMDTLGSPTKFSMCLAENEDDNPWEPFHVEKGYTKDTSTVTVHFNYGLCDIHEVSSTTPEGLIEVLSGPPTMPGHPHMGSWLSRRKEAENSYQLHDLILLCPDHAKIFAKNHWNKQKIREAIHEHAQVPLRVLLGHRDIKAVEKAHPELVSLKDNPDSKMSALEGPECYDIVVAGADVGRSMFLWGFGEPVTKPLKS